MLSHRNIIFQMGFHRLPGHRRAEGDQQLSLLPLSHVAERTFNLLYPLSTGSTGQLRTSHSTPLPDTFREGSPPAAILAVRGILGGEVLLGRRAPDARGDPRTGRPRLPLGALFGAGMLGWAGHQTLPIGGRGGRPSPCGSPLPAGPTSSHYDTSSADGGGAASRPRRAATGAAPIAPRP